MHPKRLSTILLPILLVVGCSSSNADTPTTDAAPSDGDTGATGATGDAAADVRGRRYCEVLLGTVTGGSVHVQVDNTQGLSDCPQDAWSKLDTAAIEADTGATVVVLNGPRYWMIDSFADSTLIDPTPRSFGGIPMRQAGAIDVALADVPALQKAYSLHTIARETQFVFFAGKSVFELLDASGHVYTMQSYSVQKVATQTESTLPTLGASLMLPAGWTYRTRTLTADLAVKAVNGKATVVQDDDDDTYLQSQ
jgi:hypothetical protein